MWDNQLELCLDEVRTIVKELVPLQPFDTEYDSIIFTDACSVGVGFILIQKSPANKISIMCTGSTGLTPPQIRYSVFDLELSAIVYALKKLQDYVSGGLQFNILTDHRALDKLEMTDLASITPCRTLRALEFNMSHNVTVRYIQKAENKIADYLSRLAHSSADVPHWEKFPQSKS